jgi:hypothetical protein
MESKMAADNNSPDRRQDLSAKVAVLEERSLNNKEQFEKFENSFLVHSKHEEILLNTLVEEVNKVDGKIHAEVEKGLAPIEVKVNAHEKALTRFQTIMYALGLVLSGLFAVLEYFKDPLLAWLVK